MGGGGRGPLEPLLAGPGESDGPCGTRMARCYTSGSDVSCHVSSSFHELGDVVEHSIRPCEPGELPGGVNPSEEAMRWLVPPGSPRVVDGFLYGIACVGCRAGWPCTHRVGEERPLLAARRCCPLPYSLTRAC